LVCENLRRKGADLLGVDRLQPDGVECGFLRLPSLVAKFGGGVKGEGVGGRLTRLGCIQSESPSGPLLVDDLRCF
jgi:hypothetical protein